jgi:hypothetical protein
MPNYKKIMKHNLLWGAIFILIASSKCDKGSNSKSIFSLTIATQQIDKKGFEKLSPLFKSLSLLDGSFCIAGGAKDTKLIRADKLPVSVIEQTNLVDDDYRGGAKATDTRREKDIEALIINNDFSQQVNLACYVDSIYVMLKKLNFQKKQVIFCDDRGNSNANIKFQDSSFRVLPDVGSVRQLIQERISLNKSALQWLVFYNVDFVPAELGKVIQSNKSDTAKLDTDYWNKYIKSTRYKDSVKEVTKELNKLEAK